MFVKRKDQVFAERVVWATSFHLLIPKQYQQAFLLPGTMADRLLYQIKKQNLF